jgi:thioredoxin 1
MAAENVQTFTDNNFDQAVLQSGQPVLVDFWAEWCGPCKRLGPTIDALASEYAGKITVGKLNVDDNQNTAIKYQIRGIPAVLLFKGGQIVESVVGLAPKEDFKKVIDKHVYWRPVTSSSSGPVLPDSRPRSMRPAPTCNRSSLKGSRPAGSS